MEKRNIPKAKLNIVVTLISQLVSSLCGFVLSRVLIGSFGSVVYGITTSITQFLSYISLLEGGVGIVARAEMYKPLAEKDNYGLSRVYHAVRHFFRGIAVVCIVFTLLLSLVYYDLARIEDVSRTVVFLLVWIIGSSTISKYLGGLTNLTLLVADQKQYIGNSCITITAILNVVFSIILIRMNCGILAVKLVGGLAYIMRPVCYALYVRKHYQLPPVGRDRSELKQKWSGIGQHIALYLHTNTDIVMLTLFADIRLVAVYAVYSLVVSNIRMICIAFTSGMEAAFGRLIARGEQRTLQDFFRKYQTLLSCVVIVLFSTTAILIVPFVRLYTTGVTDADYVQPVFSLVLIFAEILGCVVHPYSSLAIAANKLKQTQWGSYGEAIINVIVSLILIWWNPLVGIACGTLVATVFKSFFYMAYAARNILRVRLRELVKNFLFTNLAIGGFAYVGIMVVKSYVFSSYLQWALWGVMVVAVTTVGTALLAAICYPAQLKALWQSSMKKYGKQASR